MSNDRTMEKLDVVKALVLGKAGQYLQEGGAMLLVAFAVMSCCRQIRGTNVWSRNKKLRLLEPPILQCGDRSMLNEQCMLH